MTKQSLEKNQTSKIKQNLPKQHSQGHQYKTDNLIIGNYLKTPLLSKNRLEKKRHFDNTHLTKLWIQVKHFQYFSTKKRNSGNKNRENFTVNLSLMLDFNNTLCEGTLQMCFEFPTLSQCFPTRVQQHPRVLSTCSRGAAAGW